MLTLDPGTRVRVPTPSGALYGRLRPYRAGAGVVPVRLTADSSRGPSGACVYALAKRVRPHRGPRHASGVHRSPLRLLRLLFMR